MCALAAPSIMSRPRIAVPHIPTLDMVVYQSGAWCTKGAAPAMRILPTQRMLKVWPSNFNERLAQQHREIIAGLEAGSLSLATNADVAPGLTVPNSIEGSLCACSIQNPGMARQLARLLEVELRARFRLNAIARCGCRGISRMRQGADLQSPHTCRRTGKGDAAVSESRRPLKTERPW